MQYESLPTGGAILQGAARPDVAVTVGQVMNAMHSSTNRIYRAAKKAARKAAEAAVRKGANPAWFQYRIVDTETLDTYAQRHATDDFVALDTLQLPSCSENPLPANIVDRTELPDERGWWGYSFRDVPTRANGRTVLARLSNCKVVTRIDGKGEFWPTLVNEDGRACALREMAMRREHRAVLRDAPLRELDEAVWLLERVYHNYSHWFTAHAPKLILLRELGLTDKVLLPERRPQFVDASLRLLGFDPDSFPTFEPGVTLKVKRLTTLDTDRFRPELLTSVRDACPTLASQAPTRRIFISRQGAERRRLLTENELWPLLESRDFERVHMERLPFEEQVKLMQETAVLCAPHGAGLTNMIFCPPGTQIIEMADLSFPNPNFYAVACAMQHDYWLVRAEGVGEVHPLEKDMRVDPERLRAVLDRAVDRSLACR